MTRLEIITELKTFFAIEELVCKHTLDAFGEGSWKFLKTEMLHTLLVLRRDILCVPMTINNYALGFPQRGLRCNICQLVRDKTKAGKIYLTAHASGSATDSIPKGMTAAYARALIEANKDKLPYPIRMESGVTWLHFDTYDDCSGKKVTYFSS